MEHKTDLPGSPTLLLVDDDPQILSFLAELLDDIGYSVLTASSGSEALSTFRSHHRRITLTLLDIDLPDISGIDTSLKIINIDPSAKILFISGNPSETILDKLPGGAGIAFLPKPFDPSDVRKQIGKILTE